MTKNIPPNEDDARLNAFFNQIDDVCRSIANLKADFADLERDCSKRLRKLAELQSQAQAEPTMCRPSSPLQLYKDYLDKELRKLAASQSRPKPRRNILYRPQRRRKDYFDEEEWERLKEIVDAYLDLSFREHLNLRSRTDKCSAFVDALDVKPGDDVDEALYLALYGIDNRTVLDFLRTVDFKDDGGFCKVLNAHANMEWQGHEFSDNLRDAFNFFLDAVEESWGLLPDQQPIDSLLGTAYWGFWDVYKREFNV